MHRLRMEPTHNVYCSNYGICWIEKDCLGSSFKVISSEFNEKYCLFILRGLHQHKYDYKLHFISTKSEIIRQKLLIRSNSHCLAFAAGMYVINSIQKFYAQAALLFADHWLKCILYTIHLHRVIFDPFFDRMTVFFLFLIHWLRVQRSWTTTFYTIHNKHKKGKKV